jgi:integrase
VVGEMVGEMLTNVKVESLSKPGKYIDANGLYLSIARSLSKSWVYRYQINGKRREMGLGPCDQVSLKEARVKAGDARKAQNQGHDPKTERDKLKPTSDTLTFDQCAEAYISSHESSWRNAKHGSQWRNTLNTYAAPIIGSLPVDQVDTSLVMQIIEPIWKTKTETASRVRGRIESVISWAMVKDYHPGPNPALWRGHIDQLLPNRSKVQPVKHHTSMPYNEMQAFMGMLILKDSISARALEFTILTAVRTREALNAKWYEIDFGKKLWTIPAGRMKASREHRVPLSYQSITLLENLPRTNDFLFSVRADKPMSNMAMLTFLKKSMNHPTLTVHGFRSTFRDWAAEVSSFPRELAESALAHVLNDKTEAAYQRGDLLEKRRTMMQAWADFYLSESI